VVVVKELAKKYGANWAIKDLSFSINPGAVYGFLGPNGAGKSTTMNIIAGYLAASSGSVTIGGYDICRDPIRAKKLIGYLPEIPPVYPDMTPIEYLNFVAIAKGVKKNEVKRQVDNALEATKIGEYSKRLISGLSKGYRQRVGIAQAIIADPKVVILDEPTVGLDPQQIIDIRCLIREFGKQHTVILSSHILSEVREVCQSALIIANGSIVVNDTLENLESKFSGDQEVELSAKASKESLGSLLDSSDFVRSYKIGTPSDDGVLALSITARNDDDIRERLFFAFANSGIPILSMTAQKANLEQVFLQLTSYAGPNIDSISANCFLKSDISN
jgi:ABC-2 type transport system ATP-binding protein